MAIITRPKEAGLGNGFCVYEKQWQPDLKCQGRRRNRSAPIAFSPFLSGCDCVFGWPNRTCV